MSLREARFYCLFALFGYGAMVREVYMSFADLKVPWFRFVPCVALIIVTVVCMVREVRHE